MAANALLRSDSISAPVIGISARGLAARKPLRRWPAIWRVSSTACSPKEKQKGPRTKQVTWPYECRKKERKKLLLQEAPAADQAESSESQAHDRHRARLRSGGTGGRVANEPDDDVVIVAKTFRVRSQRERCVGESEY